MDKELAFILSLVRSAFDGSSVDLPSDTDWQKVFTIGKTYRLLPIISVGISNSNITLPDDVQSAFDSYLLSNFVQDQSQNMALTSLETAFDKNGIEYMPIKGVILKKLYPSSEFRPMGDADILIKMEQREKVDGLMYDCGFSYCYESPHELVYKKKGVCIELHKHIIPPYNKDYYSYFGDGWKLARKDSGTRYLLSDNDHYIFAVTHLAKHYRDGGVGPIHLLDLWIMQNKTHIDADCVDAELGKLGLGVFHKNVLDTVSVWFGKREGTELTEFITNRVFNSGNFGTKESRALASATKTSKSTSLKGIGYKRAVRRLFPKVSELELGYPILKKCPLLLPFCWCHRFVKTLIFRREKLSRRLDEIKNTTEEKVAAYQDELIAVGLDFNFKE
ncbi:MAG: nucleotidyltransferase family protein [Clostridia bacterium]|nr:nucleotidyltransferase family protein [Clostridia bacterium]